MLKLQIRPRIIRSFVGAPGPRQVPEAPGADPCEAPSLPSARCKMRCPEMLIIQKMAYTRGCRVYRQRGDTCVLFVRPDRAAESPNIGRKWRARARQLSSECVCPRKSWILKSREGGERRAVGRRRDVEFKMLLCLPLSEQPCLIHGFWAGRKSSIVGSGRPRKPEKPCTNIWERAISEFRIVAAKWSYLELAWGAVFWCNRCCRTNPVVLTGFDGQVWPNIGRKPAQIIIQNCR